MKDITPGSEEKTIYSSEENRIKDSNPVFYPGTKFREIVSEKSGDIRKCTMSFTTPLRLQMLGKTLNKREEVTPKILIINLMRRCLSASYLFCEDEVPVEPVFNFENIRISSNSLQFFDWERYSSRQKTRMNMGGFLGSITLEGDISAALPFIYTGSFLNAGKNTLFGLGQYTTSFV
ncbi:MAG: CRISPR system precrRNA processing endoribonuclease RAMP protein Cas6 [Ignavibacteriales bacterium]|nr:CRISPR system precrRNA processing endoribonuclease RAMP protein Cas6 [Ignavibacteriales bacterium]